MCHLNVDWSQRLAWVLMRCVYCFGVLCFARVMSDCYIFSVGRRLCVMFWRPVHSPACLLAECAYALL